MVDWKKVLGTSVLSASLIFSSFAPMLGNISTASAKSNINVKQSGDETTFPFLSKHVSGPFDAGMVNREKLLASLIKQGVINKNASPKQQEQQLSAYISKRAKGAIAITANQQDQKAVREDIQKAAGIDPAKAGASNKSKAKPDKVRGAWGGEVQTDQVLVLLVDFPDYANSEITPADNPVLLYENYTKEHYEDMIFGDGTYEGGNGEQLISMKEYYEQQSGGSYTIDGAVSKWYTASQPAAYYGGNDANENDVRPRELVQEALIHASQDPDIDLSKFDIEDIFDLDGDGNFREPDGIIDHLMIVHAGTGEEAGGGTVGADAIWSHSWNQAGPFIIPNTDGKDTSGNWGGSLVSFDYTIQPEDGATGVFAHEYGHDLGLPDEYDTAYTAGGVGAPTEYWTLMSSGGWAGKINGTEPTGFSPYNKEYLQNKWPASNWFKNEEYSLEELRNGDVTVELDQASIKGQNADAVKITLPDKITQVNTPASGQYEYFSGSGNDLDNSLTTSVDLSTAQTAELKFNAWYNIEQDWDFGSVQVQEAGSEWVAIPGNITTTDDPYQQNPGHGITGSSNGWTEAIFDLSAYAGKQIKLRINYWTDVAAALPGLYVDDLEVRVDGNAVILDDAESADSDFSQDGFTKTDGITISDHYYLIEWRSWAAADAALGRITRGASNLTLDPGMVVWYVDNKYNDNWVGDHPGDGFLGVVDAHQKAARWSDDGSLVATAYQIQDAAFSLNPTDEMFLDYSEVFGLEPGTAGMALASQPAVPQFSDYNDYTTPELIYSGRNVPKYGLEFTVLEQADDMSMAKIKFAYDNHESNVLVSGLLDTYSSNAGYNVLDLTVLSDDEVLGQEVTVTSTVVNAADEVVVSDEQTYTSDRNEKELDVNLTLPEAHLLPSGEYTLKVTVVAAGETIAEYAQTFAVDNDATPVVDNNGSEEVISKPTVTVTIDDAAEGTLEYMWSEYPRVVKRELKGSKRAVSDLEVWKSFNSGDTLTLEGRTGTFYLYVRGEDVVGNEIDWISNAFNVDGIAPVLTLAGDNPLVLPVFTAYTEPGFTATDDVDGDLTGQVTVSGSVNTNVPGEYILTYTVTDAVGNVTSETRRVHVVDEQAPIITLTGDSSMTVEAGTTFTDPGYTAQDNVDGIVTEKVVVTGSVDTSKLGVYTLSYNVTDSSGNPSITVTRTVTVKDTTAPTLALKGEATIVVEGATEFVDPGFTSSDSFDSEVTVEVAGSVNVKKVGDYVLTYTAADDSGNKTTVTRKVSVVDTTAPVIELSGEKSVVLEHGQAYVEPGFVVTDTVDGNITDYVVVSSNLRFAVGEYTVTYTVKDASGNETGAKRTVKVVDTTAPTLVLKGANPLSVVQGSKYEEPGFKATDNADGDLTDSVTVSGSVDTKTVGSYKFTYTVVDASGNKTTVERVVTVNKAPSTDNGTGNGTGKGTGTGTGKGTTGSNNGATGSSGKNLPNTATNSYNILFAGMIVLVVGVAFVVLQRRRKGQAE